MAALDHPNVVPLYEAGEEDGTVYIVTRWVEGTELGTLIQQRRPTRAGRAARIAAQIAAALEVAHEKGLDPPRRQALQRDRHLRGPRLPHRLRARQAGRDRPPGLTAADQMLGTVDYVAPEQIEGSEPDARGDVYSLACVLYEMLAGEPPRSPARRGGMAKMWAQVNAEPPPLRERRPDVPAGAR